MRPSYRVLINTGAQYFRTFVNIILSLYTVRVILTALGPQDYGIYNLVAGVVAMLAFVTNAMITTTQRFLSYNQGKDNLPELKNLFGTSLILHIVISLLLAIALLGLTSPIMSGLLNIPADRANSAVMLYYATVAMLFVSFVSAPYRALLISHENIVYVSAVDLIDAFAKVLIAFVLTLVSTNKLELYGLMLLLLSIFNILAFAGYSYVKYNECVLPLLKYYRGQYVKDIFSFAGWTIYSTGCIMIRHQGIAVILNRYLGTVVNAAYGIGFQVSSCLMNFSNAIQNALNPQLMQAEGRGDRNKMIWLSTLLSKAAFFVLSAIGIPCIFVMRDLLSWWLGDVPEYTVLFCIMTVVSVIFDMMTTGLGPANQAVGHIGKYMFLVNTPKVITLLVALIAMRGFNSVYGLVIGYIVLEIISALIRVFVSKYTCGIDPKIYLGDVLLRELVLICSLSIISYFLTRMMTSTLAFLVVICISVLFYVCMFYFIGLSAKERQLVKDLLIQILKKK